MPLQETVIGFERQKFAHIPIQRRPALMIRAAPSPEKAAFAFPGESGAELQRALKNSAWGEALPSELLLLK